MEYENHWQIMLALQTPQTLDELKKSGVDCSEEKLLLLQSMRFVKRDGKKYKTAIPILDSLQTAQMRAESYAESFEIFSEIEQPCKDLVFYLAEQDMDKTTFSLLFSHVLDNMIWKKFEEMNLTNEMGNADFWSGEYWALYNTRGGVDCGTNGMTIEKYKMLVNWTDDLIDLTSKKGLFSVNYISRFLTALDEGNGKIADASKFQNFIDLGIISTNGELRIPLIENTDDNPINILSNKIIDHLVAAFVQKTDFEKIQNEYHFANKSQTVIIYYHALMWDILDRLIEKEIITEPKIFASPETAKLEEARNVCFIVKEK